MIVQGLLIILVILIIANFAIGFFNQLSPPCMDANEYFRGARMLPDGATVGLGSIPTHTWNDYIGAKRVDMGIPGVIGLTSYNQKNGYIGDTRDSMESYINPVISALNDEDPSDCADKQVSQEAGDAIDNILQPGKKGKESKEEIKYDNKSLADFEINMEGLTSKNVDKSALKGKHMSLAHNIARDGYTSRPGDKI